MVKGQPSNCTGRSLLPYGHSQKVASGLFWGGRERYFLRAVFLYMAVFAWARVFLHAFRLGQIRKQQIQGIIFFLLRAEFLALQRVQEGRP